MDRAADSEAGIDAGTRGVTPCHQVSCVFQQTKPLPSPLLSASQTSSPHGKCRANIHETDKCTSETQQPLNWEPLFGPGAED